MAIDRWFIGGGAEHTPESARRLVYASTNGAEGVGGVNDLKVLPLTTPGQGVRVTIGSALIRSRYTVDSTETYMGTVYQQEIVATTPTGSQYKRSDLIVMRVEDPFAINSTTTPPADDEIALAPYIYIRVISGVPADTRKLQDVPGHANTTGLALARIDYPASTGTVTAGMIVDLRQVAQPRRSEVVYARPRIAEDDTIAAQQFLNGLTINGGEYFPGGGGKPNEFTVRVPDWATRMVIDASWMSIQYEYNPFGQFWVEYGDEYRAHTWPNKQQYEYATQQFSFNSPNTTDVKTDQWRLMDEVPIPTKYQGKEITFVFKGGRSKDLGARDKIWMNASGGLGMRITFAERAIDSDLL